MISDCHYEPPAYYYNLTDPYRDRFGLITQLDKDMDGGDAAHRAGVFYYGLYLEFSKDQKKLQDIKKKFLQDFSKIRLERGRYVRHPDSEKWYSNPQNFSRDQTVPLIIALGAFGEKEEITANFAHLVQAKSFYPNRLKNWTNEEKKLPFDYRDFAGPSDLGMYIRAFEDRDYHHLLYITDLQLLGNAFVRVAISYWDDHDTSDDINYTLLLLQSEQVMPTIVSKVSKWIYSKFRKVSPFASERTRKNPVASAWEYYFTYVQERPPLHRIFQCTLSKFNRKDL
jgi:hypothetical protein